MTEAANSPPVDVDATEPEPASIQQDDNVPSDSTSVDGTPEESGVTQGDVDQIPAEQDAAPAPEAPHGIRAATSGPPAKKTDSGGTPRPIDVQSVVVQKARAVFVPSIDYLQQIDALNADQRIWIVTGRAQSGKFTCALHLGLALFGQGRPLDRELYRPTSNGHTECRREDHTRGIELLRQRIADRNSVSEGVLEPEMLVELNALEVRLFGNLDTVKLGGDNENLRSERNRVLAQLNDQSHDLFGINFRDLCRWTERRDAPLEGRTLLQSLPAVKIIRRDARDALALIDMLEDQDLEPQTIYINERSFESGLKQSELAPTLQANLSRKNSYLILTTEWTEQALSTLHVPRISTRFTGITTEFQIFLHALLRSHLDYYAAVDGLPESLRLQIEESSDQILQDALRHPSTIDTFCSHLRDLVADAHINAIVKLADQVGRLDREATRSWFRALSENERLYALLAYLFAGVERYLLDDLYTLSVRYLRQDGVGDLHDPRAFGLEDIRAHVRADLTEANTIQFNNLALVEEVRRQVENYHHILWSLCENVFSGLIGDYRASTYGPFRQSLGAAIGRMGVYHLAKLQPLLDQLAAHESGGVAATAGYILDTLARTDLSHCGWVADRIEYWARSQNPDLMWAASAAVWRVYDGMVEATRSDNVAASSARLAADALERLRESLTELATHPDRFREKMLTQAAEQLEQATRQAIPDPPQQDEASRVRVETARQRMQQGLLAAQIQQWIAMIVEGVHYTLIQVSRKHAADVVALLSGWLRELPDSNQHVVGELAVQRLITDTLEAKGGHVGVARLIVERHEPLLDLVGPMLGADADTVRDILRTLRHWVQQDGWNERVHRALLGTVARATDPHRVRLAVLIAEEWADGAGVVGVIAHSIVARARLLGGQPADAYSGDTGVTLIDSTRAARRQHEIGARLTRLVAIDLAAVIPTVSGALGFVQPHVPDVNSAGTSAILAPTLSPRLLVPVLEGQVGRESPLVLALTWGQILDIDDICDGAWADKLLIGALDTTQDLPDGINQIKVTLRSGLRSAADQLIDAALVHLVRNLARRDAATWWRRVGPLIDLETPDLTVIDARLALWIDNLDTPPDRPAADPLRAVIATMCWMATADLGECVERLTRWMSCEDMRAQLAGRAAARAVFYLFGSANPTPDVEAHSVVLRLVAPLSGQGWASAQSILFAARRWAREQSWVDRLLSPPDGSPSEILRLVDALGADDRQQLTQLLDTWSLSLSEDDLYTTPSRITYLAEQIKLRLALSTRKFLPPLADGQSYGILVVDTSVARRPLRRTLAQIGALAIRSLHQHYGSAVQLLIYRLGQDYPLAGPTEQPTADVIAPSDGGAPPRLLGPLLARLAPNQVRFVLLVSTLASHDEQDWQESAWATRIHVYSHSGRSVQPFGSVPTQSTAKAGGEAITEYMIMRYPRN